MSVGGLIFLVLTPLWLALGHAALYRLFSFKDYPRSLLIVWHSVAVILVVWILLGLFEGPRFWRSATPSLFTLSLGALSAHLYFHVFNMSESSRRIRILLSLKLKEFSEANGLNEYTPSKIYENRFDRLEKLNQFDLKDGKLHSRPTILLLASVIIKNLEKLLFPERFKY